MDTFELNKWAGAVLGAALVVFVINEIGNILVHPTIPEEPAIAIAMPEGEAEDSSATAAEADAGPSLGALLAAADADGGKKVAKKCVTCHTFEKGGKNKIGPNLYGVLGRAKASVDGFGYSAAMQGAGGDWSLADMDAFLTKPKEFVEGTKMAFGGLKKPTDRADLIIYLRDFSDSPVALPSQ